MNPPLRTLRQTCGAPNLIVLLPGAYMTPEDFEKAGFFAAVSQRQLALDITAVDLDFAAISGGTGRSSPKVSMTRSQSIPGQAASPA